MPVSVLQGDPIETIFPSQTLGSAAGRTFPLGNVVWWAFATAHIVLTTTATAGSRALVIQILDFAGNIVDDLSSALNSATGTVTRYQFGAGIQAGSVNQNIAFCGTPWPIAIPPGASFKIFDSNNIDPNDTISGNWITTT